MDISILNSLNYGSTIKTEDLNILSEKANKKQNIEHQNYTSIESNTLLKDLQMFFSRIFSSKPLPLNFFFKPTSLKCYGIISFLLSYLLLFYVSIKLYFNSLTKKT